MYCAIRHYPLWLDWWLVQDRNNTVDENPKYILNPNLYCRKAIGLMLDKQFTADVAAVALVYLQQGDIEPLAGFNLFFLGGCVKGYKPGPNNTGRLPGFDEDAR